MARAYKATLIRELEKETFVAPIDIYCKEVLTRHILRTYTSLVGSFIQEQCQIARSRLHRKRRQKEGPGQPTVKQRRVAWAEAREQELGTTSRKSALAEWTKR